MAASFAVKTAPKAPKVKPTVVQIAELEPRKAGEEGAVVLSVGPEDGYFKQNLTAGVGKWARVLGSDKDGDNVLWEIAKFVAERVDDHEAVMGALMEAGQLAQAWMEEQTAPAK